MELASGLLFSVVLVILAGLALQARIVAGAG